MSSAWRDAASCIVLIGWSKIGLLCRHELAEQVRIFCRLQLNRHGTPKTVLSDREYAKGEFKIFCEKSGILIIPVAAHAHESNGMIERANSSLRSIFDRLRLCNRQEQTVDLEQEEAYAKNINRGTRLASSFELLFNRPPHLTDVNTQPQPATRVATIRENNTHILRQRVNKMIRSKVRDPSPILVNDNVYIWRDAQGWLGPARVTKVNVYDIEDNYNGSSKTCSLNV